MYKLFLIVGVAVFFFIFLIGFFLYDGHKYPICPRCEDNSRTKRKKGKVICAAHGDVTDEIWRGKQFFFSSE